jgi:hypothetical protein
MNLVYIGNFDPSHSTENHYAASLELLGHRVWRMQEPAGPAGGLHFIRRVRNMVRETRADLLLYTRTWGMPPGAATVLWREVEAMDCTTAAVHLDRWQGLMREHEVASQAMFRMQYVFTADGDAEEMYRAAGVNHHWLRPGVFEPECYDAERDPSLESYDVAFVGSAPTKRGGNYHPEWGHRAEMVAHLRDWYGDRFLHIGNGGDRSTVRGDALNRAYATISVIVGDSCLVTRGGRYWSDRVYETWGRGGFLVHPQVDALAEEIGDYPSWDVGDWDGLREEVDGWISDAEYRDEMRQRIGGFVREHCTYTQRAAELLLVAGLA